MSLANSTREPAANAENELQKFIHETISDQETESSIMKKLRDVGVDSLEDLQFLKEDDLKDVLKTVQIRKFLCCIQTLKGQGSSPTPTPSSSGVKPQPQFHIHQFDFDAILQRQPDLAEIFRLGNRPQADMRRQLVREIVDSVRKYSPHTTKKQFESIARSIVLRYPNSLEDRIDKLRIGTGYDSLLKQLVARNENLNRPSITQKSTVCSTSSSGRKKIQQDSYGCVNWGPNLSSEEEDQQQILRKELMVYYQNGDPDHEFIISKMEEAYPLLRKHINEGISVPKLLEDWPFLIEKNVLLSHCTELLGVDLVKAAETFFLNKAVRLIRFFKTKVEEVKPYILEAEKEKMNDNLSAILPLVILCIQKCVSEEEDGLFVVVDEMSSNSEVKRCCAEKPWPRLAMLGSSVLAAADSILVVDGQILGRFSSFINAISLLFGAYYIFNIQYPKEAQCTLEFIQRCSMGINPGSEMVKSSKKRKGRSNVNPKVLRLINEMADFEWTESVSNIQQ